MDRKVFSKIISSPKIKRSPAHWQRSYMKDLASVGPERAHFNNVFRWTLIDCILGIKLKSKATLPKLWVSHRQNTFAYLTSPQQNTWQVHAQSGDICTCQWFRDEQTLRTSSPQCKIHQAAIFSWVSLFSDLFGNFCFIYSFPQSVAFYIKQYIFRRFFLLLGKDSIWFFFA